MPSAPRPENETERLAALRKLEILDTPPESSFDQLTEQAARLCAAPTALISLIDDNRQWFKSRVGLAVEETCRSQAFCGYAILADDALVVTDATQDPRFSDNELVTGEPGIRSYAGVPLVLKNGQRIGTLCVLHYEQTELKPHQIDELHLLANKVVNRLEVRARRHARGAAKSAVCDLAERSSEPVLVLDRLLEPLTSSESWNEEFGLHGLLDPRVNAMCDKALLQEAKQSCEIDDELEWTVTPWRDDLGKIGGVVVTVLSVNRGRAR